jgi:hypothetical protein
MAYQISFLDRAPSPRVRQKYDFPSSSMLSQKLPENYRRRAPEKLLIPALPGA